MYKNSSWASNDLWCGDTGYNQDGGGEIVCKGDIEKQAKNEIQEEVGSDTYIRQIDRKTIEMAWVC